MNRRDVFRVAGLAGATAISGGQFTLSAAPADGKTVKFGVISDLHHQQFGEKQVEIDRLKAFIDASVAAKPDFIIQCGDFCVRQKSEPLLAEWKRFAGPRHHVLGNHDMDHGSKAAFMEYWGMERRYYSFDLGGYHFVIIDRNGLKKDDGTVVDYDRGNWYRSPASAKSHTDAEQLAWLKKDLAEAAGPVIVFMHQPVFLTDEAPEMGNWREILTVFDTANHKAATAKRPGRVAAVFMGHDHDDRYGLRNGVHYFLLNSASYAYTSKGANFYRDSLFAFVTLGADGTLTLAGKDSAHKESTSDEVKARIPPRITGHAVRV
ncbi:metallophosphoesterase family protein [Zavarzinella formosa]|uniref:metallophosphoesterase family protein n=1 Tax=Zavarzinella formosa TaxID=360055 RepID=UPI00031E20C7|nr:metallophosphoesterase [Zavarzinella formosa]